VKLIVGLGNPGKEYEATRHNVGFRVMDLLGRRWGIELLTEKFHAWFGSGRIGDERVVLLKPTTFMNLSGEAVRGLRSPTWDPAEDLLVLVDEAALPIGRFRLRGAGSSGGHNGLRSIEAHLGRQDYARLRIDVGPRPPEWDLADFVLGRFRAEEQEALADLLDEMCDAVACWAADGIERAMNRFNRT